MIDAAFLNGFLGSDWRRGGLRIVKADLVLDWATAAGILVESWRDSCGWICFTDAVARIDGKLPGGTESRVALAADLVAGKRSLQLRTTPDGFHLTEIEEDANGKGCLETVRHLMQDLQSVLVHEVWWSLDERPSGLPADYRPKLARFVGFAAAHAQGRM